MGDKSMGKNMRKGISHITFSQMIFYVSKIEYNLPSADEDHFPGFKINVNKTENYSVTLWLASRPLTINATD